MKKVNVVVKKTFRDRYTGKTHKHGTKLTVTDARFREIKRSGDYVEIEVPTVAKAPEKTETKK